MRLQPRAGAAASTPAELGRQLRDERERADAAPPVVAREHEEERQRRDGYRQKTRPASHRSSTQR